MKKRPTREEIEDRVRALERKLLERERGFSERAGEAENLRSLLNALAESVLLVDSDYKILAVNESAAQRLGKSVQEMTGTPLADHLPAEVAAFRKAWGDQVVRTGKSVCFQDGRGGRLYETNAHPVLDDAGKVRAVAVCGRDVTETMQAVKALLESEENFRSLAENASDGILIAAGKGEHVYANRRAAEITGYPIDELLRTGIRDLAHPDEVSGILRRFGKRIRGDRSVRRYETRIVRKDGAVVPVEITSSRTTWRGEPSTMVILRDITERMRMERRLRANEERFRAVFEGSLDAIFLADPETGRILDANPAASELLRREHEEIVGLHYLELAAPRWKEASRRAYDRAITEEEQTTPLEAGMLRADGSEVPVEALAQLIQIDGVPVIHAVVRDISERRRMDEDLRNSEEKFRTLAEAAPAGVFIFQDGRFLYANPALGAIFGYEVRELVGRMGPLDLIHPDDREAANAYARRCLEGDEGGSPVLYCRGLHRNGEVIDCEVLQGAVAYRGKRAMTGTLVDVTDLKRVEEELGRVQRIESLGVLAGGIAHDFNNILTAISANISMARMYGNLEEDISRMMEDAEKACIRARNLTQQLLSFATGGAPVRKAVSLVKILEENPQFALSGSNVRCDVSIPKDPWPVNADEAQVGQVVHNLVINAKQAMPEGGVIEIGAENVPPEALKNVPLEPGRYVRVTVTDHGVGIPDRHLPRVFDPFFTTKQKGSGLGLATSFTIVRNHGGHIQIDSEAGKGTTVRVYLPASDRASALEGPGERGARQSAGRVLLVDDEEPIRKSVSEALRRLGYAVALARDGAEGIRLYREACEGDGAFDAVLLDLTIPGGMGGKEAVRELLEIDPAARVIASSGYSSDPVMADYRSHGFCEAIVKPYRIDDLNETLRKVIAREAGPPDGVRS